MIPKQIKVKKLKNMNIACRQYQTVWVGIRSDRQSKPKYNAIPEVSYNANQSTKGIKVRDTWTKHLRA